MCIRDRISTGELRKGVVIELDGDLWQILDYHHIKMGRGSAQVRIKLRNVKKGSTVDLKVVETEPGFAGDTQSGARKPATTESGLIVTVPIFVEPGDTIRIDTRTGEYQTRV